MLNFSIDDVTLIPLSKGYVAIIDTADAPAVLEHKWCAVRPRGETCYATARVNGKPTLLHRFLIGVPGMYVDHRNGDGADCRRQNIRLATWGQNQQNKRPSSSTGYKGVSWCKKNKHFIAQIRPSGSGQTRLGQFQNPEDAARAYDAAAHKHFGEFAWLNFPDEVKP